MGTATIDRDVLDGTDQYDGGEGSTLASEPKQLSFFVGGATPDLSLISIGGRMICQEELPKGAEIHVQVIDVTSGLVVADGYGVVEGLSFKDKRDESNNVVETTRLHSAKVS